MLPAHLITELCGCSGWLALALKYHMQACISADPGHNWPVTEFQTLLDDPWDYAAHHTHAGVLASSQLKGVD